MEKVLVTTSWDDGHALDVRLAALLKKYRIAGTFYVSPEDTEIPADKRLSASQIQTLANDFEIGAHTMTHSRLTELANDRARNEIVASKTYLENLTNKPVESFCYPAGYYDMRHVQMVREAGFRLGRTVKRFAHNCGADLFQVPTTIHAYRHWSDAASILKAVGLRKFFACYLNWDELAIQVFDSIVRTGGVYHLWGHSWEIDKNGDWDRLERVLKHISARKDVVYVTNGGLAQSSITIKKTALFVTPYFLPHGGGLERYAFEMASRLQKDFDWHVEVLTSGEKGNTDTTEEYEGITVHRLGYQFKFSNTPFSFRWLKKVPSVIKDINPTLINVHMPVPGIGDVAVRSAGAYPVVLTYHAGTMLKKRLLLDILIWLYEHAILPGTIRRVKKLICASEFVKKTIPMTCSAAATVITPGVDMEVFKPDASVKKNEMEVAFICNVASMHRMKGLHVLMGAVAILAKKFPNISIKVVGEQGKFKSPYTHYVGRKSGGELVKEIQSSALLVLPSLAPAESFGMVLIEAMACKVPVVGSNAGGIPEVITDGSDGFVVGAGDSKGLAMAIERILSNTVIAKEMGERGYQKVKEKFTWQQKVCETVRVFEALIP